MTRFRWVVSAAAGLSLLGAAQWAAAAPIPASLMFENTPGTTGGTISYAGGAAPELGTNIITSTVHGSGTPLNSGVTLQCDNPLTLGITETCALNFTTGANAVAIGVGGGVNTYIFTPPGVADTYTITGNLYTSGGALIASGTLVNGQFTSFISADTNGLTGPINTGGLGTDVKNPALAAFFGLGPNFTFANSQLVAAGDATVNPAAPFNYTGLVSSNRVINTNVRTVPQPASLLLMGVGLLALLLFARRQPILPHD